VILGDPRYLVEISGEEPFLRVLAEIKVPLNLQRAKARVVLRTLSLITSLKKREYEYEYLGRRR